MGMIQRRKMLFDGQLPPIITKIVGGSFQVDESFDKTARFTLEHNLGVQPRGYIVYDNVFKNTVTSAFDIKDSLVRLIGYKYGGNEHYTSLYYRETCTYSNNTNGDLITIANHTYDINFVCNATIIRWSGIKLTAGRTYEFMVWA